MCCQDLMSATEKNDSQKEIQQYFNKIKKTPSSNNIIWLINFSIIVVFKWKEVFRNKKFSLML